MVQETRQRAPQARLARNHARVLDAAARSAAQNGPIGLSFLRVANEAGLSRRPIQDRFHDVTELSIALWKDLVGPELITSLNQAMTYAGLLDEPQNVAEFVKACARFQRPDHLLLAGVELFLDSQFDEELSRAIQESLTPWYNSLCVPSPDITPALAARRAWIIMMGLGLILFSHRPGARALDCSWVFQEYARTFAQAHEPIDLPEVAAPHLNVITHVNTGDSILNALIDSVLRHVAQEGYLHASVEKIVATANCSQGALFSRFATKKELFLEATRLQNETALAANEEYLRMIEQKSSREIAEAVAIREFQKPGRELQRALLLEQLRLTWHDEELLGKQAETVDAFYENSGLSDSVASPEQFKTLAHVGLSIGTGATALPLIYKESWRLPFDVVAAHFNNG
ncbi:MAG: TetR/AcrR family transcriptional regulator [Actinomycetes bacterium]